MYEELIKWIALIELPIFAGLFRIMFKQKKEGEVEVDRCKDALADFKLHVAKNYVSTTYLKDVETRLTDHLLRIEKKLDTTGKKK